MAGVFNIEEREMVAGDFLLPTNKNSVRRIRWSENHDFRPSK